MRGRPAALRALIGANVVAGAVAAALVVVRYGDVGVGELRTFLVLAAALVVTHVVPLPVPRGEQLEDVQLEEPFIVAALVVLPPSGVLAAAVIASVAGNVQRRRGVGKSAFNLGITAAAIGLAVLAREAAGTVVPAGSATGAVAAAALGALLFVCYQIVCVYAVISIADERSFVAVARESFAVGALVSASGISIGLALGLASRVAWWAPLTLLPPGVVVLLLLRGHLQALRDRQRLDGLLRAASDAHRFVDVRQVSDSVRDSTKALLRAGDVRLGDDPPAADELGSRVMDGAAQRWLVVRERHHLDPFEQREQQLLDGLATIGSAALSNAHLVEQVQHQVVHDPLTDLPNRLLFEDRVSQAAARGSRFGERFAVLFLGIDRFKRVNDSLGHALGDELLRQAAERLLAGVRATDTVARTAGDEFAVLLAGIHDSEEPLMVAESILDRLRAPFYIAGRQLFVTASAGIALYPEHGADHARLLANADAALLRAKERGRDTFEVFSHDSSLPAAPRLLLESQLHGALERGEIWVAYQPLVDVRRGVATGAEALVRWRHPTLGELTPDEFLPVAEESGLVAQLDTFVLLTSCRQAVRWNSGRTAVDRMHVAVNFSARQLHSPRLLDIVTDSLAATGLAPQLLEVEVTERLAGRDAPELPAVLSRLRALGVRVAMDDFGTGYSALSRLDGFPLDNVKIDKSFVRRIVAPGDEAPIVAASIAMAHGLGLRVTAEGVESTAQLDYLERHGCDVVQGYLLGRPEAGGGARPVSLRDIRLASGN